MSWAQLSVNCLSCRLLVARSALARVTCTCPARSQEEEYCQGKNSSKERAVTVSGVLCHAMTRALCPHTNTAFSLLCFDVMFIQYAMLIQFNNLKKKHVSWLPLSVTIVRVSICSGMWVCCGGWVRSAGESWAQEAQGPGDRRAVTRPHTGERREQWWDGDNAEDISLYGHTGGGTGTDIAGGGAPSVLSTVYPDTEIVSTSIEYLQISTNIYNIYISINI